MDSGNPSRGIETPGVEPPQYTAAEEEQLSRQLFALQRAIERGDHSDRRLDIEYLCELHRGLFDAVRSFAGKLRRPGFGSEHLVFGPNRSVHRDHVAKQLDEIFETVRRSVQSARDNPDAPKYELSVLQIAVWAHAEVVRVHPFEDGNGRTSRLLLDSILVRLGLSPIPIETARQTYCDCLNRYFDGKDLEPLVDLYIRLAAEE